MLLALLGTMHVLGVPLGITAALALALVLGMSVDYIIHLAHAYKNSMFSDRYHKSRAAIFARGQSIASAAITTLGAVMPLLWAQLLPLRQFGTVFALVTVISLAFAFFFLAILMVIGPLRTRAGARAPGPAAAQRPHAAETERVGMISGLTTLQRPTPSNHKYQHDEAGAQVDPNPGRSRQSEDDEDEEML
jgi:predicted exporter